MKRYLAVGVVLLILGIGTWMAWPAKNTKKEAAAIAPSSLPAPPTVRDRPEPTPAPKIPVPRVVKLSARHKHRFRDCEGVLTLTVNRVRFSTIHPRDSFDYTIDQVDVDKDGVKDHMGKAWHFVVEGRDMENVFRQWKLGVLPAQ